MSAIPGKKMSDFTPLEDNEKEYFMGDGEGSVLSLGKVAVGGNIVNRLVKIDDILSSYSVDTMTGATDQAAGSSGLVPAPAISDKDKFLKGDGTWAAAGGSTGGGRSFVAITNEDIHLFDGTLEVTVQDNAFNEYAVPQGGFDTISIIVPPEAAGKCRDLYVHLITNSAIGQLRQVDVLGCVPYYASTQPVSIWLSKKENLLLHIVHDTYTATANISA